MKEIAVLTALRLVGRDLDAVDDDRLDRAVLQNVRLTRVQDRSFLGLRLGVGRCLGDRDSDIHAVDDLSEDRMRTGGVHIVVLVERTDLRIEPHRAAVLTVHLELFLIDPLGFSRFFVEALRTDSLMIGPFKQAQVISLCAMAAGILLYIYSSKHLPLNEEGK